MTQNNEDHIADELYETYLSKEARENWREIKGLNY